MRTLLLVLMISLSTAIARGQVIINVQLPPSGLMVKSQLWNLSLVNTSSGVLDVQIEMTLTDFSNNQKVLTGTTRSLRVPKGLKQVRANEVAPVNYNVINAGYGIDINQDGFLPVGKFILCFTVISLTGEDAERITEECETIEIEPLSPPMLVSPSNNEDISTSQPLFTWSPPAPYTLFNNLRYELVLVEISELQTAAEAIQQNIPVLTQGYLLSPQFMYPVSSLSLDTSKTYAWQITAKNNSTAVAKSEIWSFRIKQEVVDGSIASDPGFYVKLKKDNDGSFVTFNRLLKYEYLNELNDKTAVIHITDISTASNKKVALEKHEVSLQYGQNFLDMLLSDNPSFINNHIYLLELVNSKNEKWLLKFQFRKKDK